MSSNAVTPGQRVELKIRGLGSTSGNVEVLAENSIVIALVVDPGASAATLGDPDATLEFPAVRGIYRQEGFARFEGAARGSVQFISSGEPELVQRRDFARVDVRRPVRVTPEGSPPNIYETLNISANGLLLAPPPLGAHPLKLGMIVWLKMDLDDGEGFVEARGTAVREAGNGAVGIRYDHISEDHQEQLARFVFHQELEQRRKAVH
jgi:predicted Zn-dependent protease